MPTQQPKFENYLDSKLFNYVKSRNYGFNDQIKLTENLKFPLLLSNNI